MAQRLFRSILRDLVDESTMIDAIEADGIVDFAGVVLDDEEPSAARFLEHDRELAAVRDSLGLAIRGLIVRGRQRKVSAAHVQHSIVALLDNYERYLTFRVLHLRR